MVEARSLGAGWVEIEVVIDVLEQGRAMRYRGRYTLVSAGEQWWLDQGSLSPLPSGLALMR